MKARIRMELCFRKERAAELLEAILLREPIEVPADGWSQSELLQLSAVAILLASEQTPVPPSESFEILEARVQTSYDDCFTAMEFFADLTSLVRDNVFNDEGRYDDQFEPLV